MSGAPEKTVLKQIMLAASKAGAIIFRQNVGQAWQGSKVEVKGKTVVIQNAMPITMGLTNGSSDLIGWKSFVIEPHMVGQKVAVFVAIEAKREKGGRTSKEQQTFIDAVRSAGGIAGVANSPEAAVELLITP